MKDKQWDWEALVLSSFHPITVAALEAMLWIDEPFSAADLSRMHVGSPGVPVISYHLKALESDLSVLRLYREEAIKGVCRKLYFFRGRTPASRRRERAA